MNTINVGVVGATGLVGETFLQILEERNFPFNELRLFASEASTGQTRTLNDQVFTIDTLKEGCFDGLDLVFFSSGDDISREWAPKAVAAGAVAVDNSAAFRMNPEVPLVVPEVNADLLPAKGTPAIIANPNCSTIQLVVALAPLQKAYGIKEVRVASYQSVSGAGRGGLEELFAQTAISIEGEQPETSTMFPRPIAFDCLPQIGSFTEEGFCTEEMKIMKETRKILRQDDLRVSAFTVRVPTINSHSEAVWVTLNTTVQDISEIEETLRNAPGLQVSPRIKGQEYPTKALASGTDPVYVGRIHRDLNDSNTWLMWVVADNLRKGAALNGMQIAEHIFDIKN